MMVTWRQVRLVEKTFPVRSTQLTSGAFVSKRALPAEHAAHSERAVDPQGPAHAGLNAGGCAGRLEGCAATSAVSATSDHGVFSVRPRGHDRQAAELL